MVTIIRFEYNFILTSYSLYKTYTQIYWHFAFEKGVRTQKVKVHKALYCILNFPYHTMYDIEHAQYENVILTQCDDYSTNTIKLGHARE